MATLVSPTPFDVLTATATSLLPSLQNGTLTSVQLVTAYLSQITTHNHSGLSLRALISVTPAPIALAHAHTLDRERAAGTTRGPLHGTPIIIKDTFATSSTLGLPTTVGAVAFESCFATHNAAVVERLLQQGLIILGKASLTEFCGLKATRMAAGWSAVNGQTQSPYVRGGFRADDLFMGRSGPGGSSSGSAVGIAAGFAPLGLGTETSGSVCMPANRAGLYAMKGTHGSMELEGVFALSRAFDGVGAMARSAGDLALVMGVLNGARAGERAWGEVRVGFVDPKIWDAMQFQRVREGGVEEQIIAAYEWAIDQIRQRGGAVVYPVSLPTLQEPLQGQEHSLLLHQFPSLFEEFCSKLDNPKVRSVPELIEFNKQNASRAMPEPHNGQTDLIATLEYPMTDADAAVATNHGRRFAGPEGIDRALRENEIDFIIGPGDCSICSVASLAGYPTAMVPLGILEGEQGMGQPQGLMMVSSAGGEGKMLEFMRLWEEVVGEWKVPPLLRPEDGVRNG